MRPESSSTTMMFGMAMSAFVMSEMVHTKSPMPMAPRNATTTYST